MFLLIELEEEKNYMISNFLQIGFILVQLCV